MNIIVSAHEGVTKGGLTITVSGIPLTGFGPTRQAAMLDIEGGLRSWCHALARQGVLVDAAKRAQMTIIDDGAQAIEVTVNL